MNTQAPVTLQLQDESGDRDRLLTNPWRALTLIAMIIGDLSWIIPAYRLSVRGVVPVDRTQVYLVFGPALALTVLLSAWLNARRVRRWIHSGTLVSALIVSEWIALKVLLYPGEALTPATLFRYKLAVFANDTIFLPVEFFLILAVLLLWWRGVHLSEIRINPDTIVPWFRSAVVFLLVVGALSTLTTGELPYPEVFQLLFAGLLATGASRLSSLSKIRGGGRSPFNRPWLVTVGLTAAGVVALAGFVAYLAGGRFATFMAQAALTTVEWVARMLLFLLWGFITIAANLLSPVINWIAQFWRPEQEIARPPDVEPTYIGELVEQINQGLQSSLGEQMVNIFKGFLLWGFLAVVVLIVLTRARRFGPDPRRNVEGEREAIPDREKMSSMLRRAVGRGAQRVRAGLNQLRYPDRALAAARIRRIYVELLRLSADLGCPRPAQDTPQEYLLSLREVYASHQHELELITRAYERVRYGELPETRAEVVDVEAAWEKVLARGEAIRAEQRRRGRRGARAIRA